MGRVRPTSSNILRWSASTPASDVQDPLGLNLRGSTRLANRLLFCITSITPRARYFSFLPWCVHDYRRNEKGKPAALGLREEIQLREHALALGCLAHHGGRTCAGGGLVGSDKAIAWLDRGDRVADFAKLLARDPFTKNPALDAYFNSLSKTEGIEHQQRLVRGALVALLPGAEFAKTMKDGFAVHRLFRQIRAMARKAREALPAVPSPADYQGNTYLSLRFAGAGSWGGAC